MRTDLPPGVLHRGARLIVLGLSVAIVAAACAPTAVERQTKAEGLMSGVRLGASVTSMSMVATKAFADFGVDEGIRFVKVRIIDKLELRLRVEAAADVVFAEDPRMCLVGPDSAPDDAGLEEPCWGAPDVSALMAAEWPRNAAGQATIVAGPPLEFAVQLERGGERCDYPPGGWTLQLKGQSLVDGSPTKALWAPDAEFEIEIASDEPLPYFNTGITRYCGLATLEDGEPETFELPQ